MDSRTQFGPVAESYLTSASHSNEDELADFVRLVGPNGGSVLDIATGAGHVAYAFAPHADRVLATDITPEMLEIVVREAANRGLTNVDTALMSAEDLDLGDASMQGVVCRLAAHHFHNLPQFLREVYRVLVPGGWFLLVDTCGIDGDAGADAGLDEIERLRDPSHVRNLTPETWRAALESHGFEVEKAESLAHEYGVIGWMDRMRVEEPQRSRVVELMKGSSGALREYLRPAGDGESMSFWLHQVVFFCRKPLGR